uniref:Uncharacterized protein n=1 Tax=Brassica campestris TaxID=3711 RepID=M4F7L3_BRACM
MEVSSLLSYLLCYYTYVRIASDIHSDSIHTQMEAKMGLLETELKYEMAILREEINVLKGKDDEKIPSNAGNSKVQDDDDTCSNTMSWMVQTKKSSIDGLPIQRVVKKEKKNKKTMPVKEDVKPLKKVKTEKAFSIPELNDQSISTDDWENNLKWEKSVKCRQVLEALVSDVEPRRRRKQQLTKTQVWPFVGNPTVKRIITGVSKEPYDPLSKVDPDRKEKDESGFAYVST